MTLQARIESFKTRTAWLSTITGNPVSAASYLVKAKINDTAQGYGRYKNFPLTFRKQDMSALKEVLVDQEYAFLTSLVTAQDSPAILDIGAHIGTFALWALSENPNARIFSVEADPRTYNILQKNRDAVHKAAPHWTMINRAAWADDSHLSFSSDQSSSMSHKVSPDGTIQVHGISLKALIAESGFETIDLIKLDIEGAEEEFLSHHEEELSRIKNLVIEIHPRLCSEDNIRALLARHFPVINDIGGRISSKPLLFCAKE